MKTIYAKLLASALICGALTSCGDKFLETDIYNGIDMETGLDNATNIGYALNGTYYRLQYYAFAGNYATNFGDVASDVSYWNGKSGHFSDIYQFSPTTSSTYLLAIWSYGYKVADNTSRIIKASEALYAEADEDVQWELDGYLAQAYALRAYADLSLVNTFAHQYKVNGQDFGSQPGIVLIDTPNEADTQVSRSTVAETYASIEADLEKSLEYFDKAGGAVTSGILYMTPTAVKALQARVYLYEEKWQEALDAATEALADKGISSLATTPEAYAALYAGGQSNTESFFCLAINSTTNWSANSSGTLWSTYNYSPSPWLQSVMAEDDVRRSIWTWADDSTPTVPIFGGGKFLCASGNPAEATTYLLNAPEMFLIQAEANLQLNKLDDARNALLVVAKRNPAITSVADLPTDADALYSFLKEERARELFQEGHRLWDLRRWDAKANVYATGSPAVSWFVKDFKISDCVYPIPDDEINTGMGVEQNEGWLSTFPSL